MEVAMVAAVLVFLALIPAPTGGPPRGRRRSEPRLMTTAVAHVRARARRRPVIGSAVPQTLELLARSLRAGASLRTAIEAVASDFPESGLSVVGDRVRGGLSIDEAIDSWATGSADRQTAAALLVLGHRSGAAMASSLDRAAASIRQRRALGDEIRALTAQARMSGVVVAAAPAAFGAVIALVDGDVLSVLLTTPVGLVSLTFGVVLECLGVWWMSRLSRGVAIWA